MSLGSQPTGYSSREPGGMLFLLSSRPAVNFSHYYLANTQLCFYSDRSMCANILPSRHCVKVKLPAVEHVTFQLLI